MTQPAVARLVRVRYLDQHLGPRPAHAALASRFLDQGAARDLERWKSPFEFRQVAGAKPPIDGAGIAKRPAIGSAQEDAVDPAVVVHTIAGDGKRLADLAFCLLPIVRGPAAVG